MIKVTTIKTLLTATLLTALYCNQQKGAGADAAATALSPIDTSRFIDERDGREYRTVKIGEQVWMAENLNFDENNSYCYENADSTCAKYGRSYCYEDADSTCAKYGRLYVWVTVADVCPAGWHLPSGSEWDALVKAAGGDRVAGKRLKSKTGWAGNGGTSGNGTDDFGFAALPGGQRNDRGHFHSAEWYGWWWSADEHGDYDAAYRAIVNVSHSDGVDKGFADKWLRLSVRCVLGNAPPRPKAVVLQPADADISSFTDSRDGREYRAVTMGEKTWMAENLNYAADSSVCKEQDLANCAIYGRLYDFERAKTACPSGWHLPSRDEWRGLMAALGGVMSWSSNRRGHYESYHGIGEKLKSKMGWKDDFNGESGNGTDDFGFAALPGGSYYIHIRDSGFATGESGNFWSASAKRMAGAYVWSMRHTNADVVERLDNKSTAYSVRCVKD